MYDELEYFPFSTAFRLSGDMLQWMKDNMPDYQFGILDGMKVGIYCRPEDMLAFKLRFGI